MALIIYAAKQFFVLFGNPHGGRKQTRIIGYTRMSAPDQVLYAQPVGR